MNFEYCEGKMHVIKEGDTLYQLSRQYNVPLALILRANPITDVYNLQIGDEICIPTMVGRPPERPEMPQRPQNPEMGRPEMPQRPQNPEMGRPEMPQRPQNPEMERPEMPQRPTMQEMSNNLGRNSRLLTMPQFPKVFTYTIENEDSLEDILDEFEIRLEDLLNFNELDDIMLLPGSVVKVPVRRDREED